MTDDVGVGDRVVVRTGGPGGTVRSGKVTELDEEYLGDGRVTYWIGLDGAGSAQVTRDVIATVDEVDDLLGGDDQ